MRFVFKPLTLTLSVAGFCFAGEVAAQTPDSLTDFQIIGKVYEPQAVSPTDERIAQVRVPIGTHLHRFAEGLYNPRIIAVADDGTVYVTQRTPGNLVMIKDRDGDGVADTQRIVLRAKDLHGIAIKGRMLYLVDVHRVYESRLRDDGSLEPLRVVTRNLPDAGQHPNRTLRFGPDGELYLSIGSTCNACDEPNKENATLVRVDVQTGQREIVATGLRNTIGFDWHPGTGRLFGMDHGIDWLGDDEQVEELNEIQPEKKYGWPFVYGDGKFNPQDEPLKVTQQEWAAQSTSPVAGYAAHAAPMQMQFAPVGPWSNSALIAMHGSWNRKPASGYEVVQAQFGPGGEFTGFQPFISGFLVPQPKPGPPLPGAQTWPLDGYLARPVGVAFARDGAPLIGDDANHVIYRLTTGALPASLTPQKLAKEILAPQMPASIAIGSRDFTANGPIPVEHSDYGEGRSPTLSWSGVPTGTRALVLLMEDPQAASPLPFVHWIAVIPPWARHLPAGIPPIARIPVLQNAQQGSNSRSETGYFGPRPPAGDPPHPYHFQLFALDAPLSLPAGFNRHAVIEAMKGRVLAYGEVIGTFAKP
jgi:Raf kinase inhibitor-like YbhB/YbcL family protein